MRQVGHAQRHGVIFTAYRALRPGAGFVLVNDHDPRPLRYQFEAQYAGSSPGTTWRPGRCCGGCGSAAPAPGTMHGEYKPPGGKLVAADADVAGFTPAEATTAVRRALNRPTGWRDHDWRFIREEPQDPALHMALDEVLAREVGAGRRPPTLRTWEWSAPAVVIGSSSRCATRSTWPRRAVSA